MAVIDGRTSQNYRHSRVACSVLRYGGECFSGRDVRPEGMGEVLKSGTRSLNPLQFPLDHQGGGIRKSFPWIIKRDGCAKVSLSPG